VAANVEGTVAASAGWGKGIAMNLTHYRESAQKHGVPSALFELACHAARRTARVTVWNAVVVTMDTLDKAFLHDKDRRGRFLSPRELYAFAKDPEYELSEDFLGRALSRRDRCFGFVENGALASYGWYAAGPTEAADGLVLRFDPAYAYMYKGFTHPDFRGHRLHALGMASALEALTREGKKGLVSYVEASNLASMKSCARMGYRTFGHVILMKTRRGVLTYPTPGCRAYGFGVETLSGTPRTPPTVSRKAHAHP
jgi:hypothetical protein